MPKKIFSYLKKGDGTSRFGKIHYPTTNTENPAPKRRNRENSSMNDENFEGKKKRSGEFVSSDSGRFTGSAENNHVEVVDEEKCYQMASFSEAALDDSSFQNWKQHQLENLETRKFEMIERLTQNLSLNSESSFYQRLIHDDVYLPGFERFAAENHRNDEHRNIEQPLSNDKIDYNRPHFERFHQNPSSLHRNLSTVREASVENVAETENKLKSVEQERKTSNNQEYEAHKKSSSNSIETGTISSEVPSTSSNIGFFNPQRFPPFSMPDFMPPFLRPNFPQPEIQQQKQEEHNDKRLIEAERKLEKLSNTLLKDIENFESLKEKVKQNEIRLDNETAKLKNERREFDVYLAEEMKKVDKERDLLSKDKNSMKKKQNEQISLLRQQILDLQNDMCERESKFSGLRAKVRQLEVELSGVKEENEILRTRCRNLEDNSVKLDKENAQLRCKNWSLKENLPLEFNKASTLKTPILTKNNSTSNVKTDRNSNSSKSVRFLLPDESPIFQRTEDRCVQTLTPAETSTQTSVIIETPKLHFATRPTSFDATNILTDGNRQTLERCRSDGSKEIIHPTGTVQEVYPDGRTIFFTYPNGDTRKVDGENIEIYHFASSNITQIKHPSGLIIVRYKDGREEKHFIDGRVEITTPDRVKRTISSDGVEITEYPDGTIREQKSDGILIFNFTDGSKEIRTPEYTQREFSNGDVKILYKDGKEETRLKCGRVRIKDSDGRIIKDEQLQKDKMV